MSLHVIEELDKWTGVANEDRSRALDSHLSEINLSITYQGGNRSVTRVSSPLWECLTSPSSPTSEPEMKSRTCLKKCPEECRKVNLDAILSVFLSEDKDYIILPRHDTKHTRRRVN